jgi:hypothetical protein
VERFVLDFHGQLALEGKIMPQLSALEFALDFWFY